MHALQQALGDQVIVSSETAKPSINQDFLNAMLSISIPQDKAELALLATGNISVEVATGWLFDVPEEELLAEKLKHSAQAVSQSVNGHTVSLQVSLKPQYTTVLP